MDIRRILPLMGVLISPVIILFPCWPLETTMQKSGNCWWYALLERADFTPSTYYRLQTERNASLLNKVGMM